MRKTFSVFLACLFCTLFADHFSDDEDFSCEPPEIWDYKAATQEVHNQRENYFLTATDFRIPLKVNPITGEYCEQEEDLIIAGSEPISLRRFYNSHAPHNACFGMWRYNPESFFVANLELDTQEVFASVGSTEGSISSLKRLPNNGSIFYYEVPKGFQTWESDGQSHPLNTQITYQKIFNPKDKLCFQYVGMIKDGSGRQRSFCSPMHYWVNPIVVKKWKRVLGIKTKLYHLFTPDVWTPYHIPITEEKLPNGNILCYTYTQWQKEKDNYPFPQLLASITAYNSDKSKILGSMQIQYPRRKHNAIAEIQVTGSDGRLLTLYHEKPPVHLIDAKAIGKPPVHYDYDVKAIKKIIRPEGRMITTEYNSDKKVTSQYAPVGPNGEMCPIARYSYNSYMTQVVDAEGNKIDYHFDPDEGGNCTHTYNSQGVTETIFNNESKPLTIVDALGNATLFSYSYKAPYTETITNPKGIQTIVTYDCRGREKSRYKKNKEGEIIQKSQNEYDKNGNLSKMIHTTYVGSKPIKTITHIWEYGPLDRLERFLEAGEKESRYLYDSKGRLATIIKSDGNTLLHEYDDLGRLLHYSGKDFDYHYTYDERDRIALVLDQQRKERTVCTYDPLSNLLEEQLGSGLAISNAYDQQGRKINCRVANSSPISYSYEGIYLSTISWKGHTYNYKEHNLEGELIGTISPMGKFDITRDPLGRITSLTTPFFSSYSYKFDSIGNLLSYAFKDSQGEKECCYQYDDLDQLIKEEGHSYSYDSLQNRIKKDSYQCAINSFCQITDDGENEYRYDLCGNLIWDGKRKYSYDTLGRLISVEEGEQRVEYSYGAFHRRLSKTIYCNGCKKDQIFYLWEGKNEIGSVDEKGEIQELRILGEGLGAEIGAAVFYELKGIPYLPIHDHRGCVVALVDLRSGKEKASYRYTAFGEEEVHGMLSLWRFSSKRVDEETGFLFFGRRYYHPILGRWMTQDPEGFVDGANLYAYLHNCPLTDWDLYGLWSVGWLGRGAWDFTTSGLGYGLRNIYDGFSGLGHGIDQMGQWMYADFQSEFFNDSSFFQNKSHRALEGWKSFGRVVKENPFGTVLNTLVPGAMETWNNPTSFSAWGKGTVDVGTICFAGAKLGKAAAISNRVGKIGKELVSHKVSSFEANLIKDVRFNRAQLQHSFKHAKDFGITTNPNNQTLLQFSDMIRNHISATNTQTIHGTYRRNMVIHFVNPNSRLNVICDPQGNFISGWKLSPKQLEHVIRDGKLGGG